MKYFIQFIILILIVGSFSCKNPNGDLSILDSYKDDEKLLELTKNSYSNIWIIDVRGKNEFCTGHIPTARCFPYNELENLLKELPKEYGYIVCCESGFLTPNAVKLLKEKGYKYVVNFGGIFSWDYGFEKCDME